jgi:beta-lactamase class A
VNHETATVTVPPAHHAFHTTNAMARPNPTRPYIITGFRIALVREPGVKHAERPPSQRATSGKPERLQAPPRDKNPNGTTLALRELVRLAIVESDGTASDVLMRAAGGPSAALTLLRALPQRPRPLAEIPHAAAAGHDGLDARPGPPEGRAARRHAGCAQDGHFGHGEGRAHKTGTSGTEKGVTAATNDIGIITLPDGRHLAVAVFVADAKADQATREGVIARIARAAWDFYVKP